MLAILAGCAGQLDYKVLRTYMEADQCPAAVGYIQKHESDYGENQRLLFLLDSGMINLICGNHAASNEFFHRAEDLAVELWTKSLSKEAASLLTNDFTIPYAGEEFEAVLINLFSAINYIKLGDLDEALVEFRRLDANLRAINDKYEKKNVYKEDAFARYLSGILYEADNSPDEAFIDYYKSLQVFRDYEKNYGTPVPRILLEDLFRNAETVRRLDEVESIEWLPSGIKWLKQEEAEGLGKIIVIHLNGRSPVKKETKIYVPTKDGPVTVSFPKYVVKPPRCRSSSVAAESASYSSEAKAELFEDINEIAVKNLADRKARVILKTALRVAAKQAAIHKIAKDDTVQQLFNLANTMIERADTRTWRTLPGEIYLSRLFVPEGSYSLYVSQCGNTERVGGYVNVKAGDTKFVIYESMF